MAIARIFEDPDFEVIAEKNMQWIAGLNAGVEKSPGIYEGISMIYSIGTNYITPWTRIPGSISSGFCANRQFRLKHLDELSDEPKFLTLEDWILYDGTWLSGLSEMERPFILRVIPQYKGEVVKAKINLANFPQEYTLESNSNEKFTLQSLSSSKPWTVKLTWVDVTIEEKV